MPASALVLAMDLGSSSVRSALFTDDGTRLALSTASRKYSIAYTAAGGAELSAPQLLRAARACVAETLRWRAHSRSARRQPLIAVAGSGFWHGLLGLNGKGSPSTPIYTWADSRGTPDAAALRARLDERTVHQRTGCMLRAPFWPAKLLWLRRTQRGLFRQTTRWTSPASWIFDQLFGVNLSSASMASGSGLYHLARSSWDAELCGICRVRPAQLDSLGEIARVRRSAHRELLDLPLFPAIGDGAASNLGSGAIGAGQLALTIGTSAALRTLRRRGQSGRLPFGLFEYAVDDDHVVRGGAISNAGNLREWFLRELRLADSPAKRRLARVAAAEDTLTVLPFWVSERSPTWPEELRGVIAGLTAATAAEQILRAAITSTYYRLADILAALATKPREIVVSGGILQSSPALALLADCLGQDLTVSREMESSLRGGAVHALRQLGGKVKPLRRGRIVRHDRELAARHRQRRARQHALEARLR